MADDFAVAKSPLRIASVPQGRGYAAEILRGNSLFRRNFRILSLAFRGH
jgi:hypothetical protein